MKTVAVDFDKVIHAYSKGWQDGSIYDELVPGTLDALPILMQRYAVFIHTTREPPPVAGWVQDRTGIMCTLREPAEFWNEHGKILVTRRKYPAFAYIDDRGIRFVDWIQTLADLEQYEHESLHR